MRLLGKNQQNQNEAFDATEAPEMLAIVIADQEKQGLFLLPKECLIQQKFSNESTKGKMAARFYPSWCQNLNQTAKNTKWQLAYFTDLSKTSAGFEAADVCFFYCLTNWWRTFCVPSNRFDLNLSTFVNPSHQSLFLRVPSGKYVW